jgi:hypothetical protein
MIPVYTLIKNSIQDSKTDLTDAEKQALVQSINTIDKNGAELIYAIIRSYENDMGGDSTIPFNGKIQKSGIRFELESLDITLKKILLEFVKKHGEVGVNA